VHSTTDDAAHVEEQRKEAVEEKEPNRTDYLNA
jgi:hypothetical protein